MATAEATLHARSRMQGRGISERAVEDAIFYGRVVYTRGAVVHAIGRNEIAHYAEEGIDLSAYNGVQVVCSRDGSVITVYRNRDFRGLRTGQGRGRGRGWRVPAPRLVSVGLRVIQSA